MISLVLALILAPPQQAAALEPITATDAVALFKRVCAEPFPDLARFKAVVETPELGLHIVPKPKEAEGQPGDRWERPNAQIGYMSADWLPRDLPSPQCTLRAKLDAVPDHAAIASAVATAVGLPMGKTRGKRELETQWDVAGPLGNFRYFLATSPNPGDSNLSLSVLNLRDVKKK